MKRGTRNRELEAKKSPPKKIGEVLANLMAQRGYAQLASTAELRNWWKGVVDGMPGKLEKFSMAKELKKNVLHVVVTNSVIMQELTFRKQELIQSLNAAKPDQSITDIRFRLGTIN